MVEPMTRRAVVRAAERIAPFTGHRHPCTSHRLTTGRSHVYTFQRRRAGRCPGGMFWVTAAPPSGVLAFELREVTVRRCDRVGFAAGSMRPAKRPVRRDRWRRALWPSISHNLIEGADARMAHEHEQLQL